MPTRRQVLKIMLGVFAGMAVPKLTAAAPPTCRVVRLLGYPSRQLNPPRARSGLIPDSILALRRLGKPPLPVDSISVRMRYMSFPPAKLQELLDLRGRTLVQRLDTGEFGVVWGSERPQEELIMVSPDTAWFLGEVAAIVNAGGERDSVMSDAHLFLYALNDAELTSNVRKVRSWL